MLTIRTVKVWVELEIRNKFLTERSIPSDVDVVHSRKHTTSLSGWDELDGEGVDTVPLVSRSLEPLPLENLHYLTI
jgi:hypothetical protein